MPIKKRTYRRRPTKALKEQWCRDGLVRCLLAKSYLEANGYYASLGETEYNGRKHDLFGFADLIAFPRDNDCQAGPFLVQVTTIGSMGLRMKKISRSTAARQWSNDQQLPIYVFGYISTRPPSKDLPSTVRISKSTWTLTREPQQKPPLPCIYELTEFR
jgi:hypothetical protein